MNRKLYVTCISLLSVLILEACGDTRVIPASEDSTPPIVNLDLYGIPGDGSYTPPPFEDVSSDCCDISRVVMPNNKIVLIASGEDRDSGILRISIKTIVTVSCTQGGGITPVFLLKDIAQNKSTESPDGSVSTFLLTEASIRLADYENNCKEGSRVEQYNARIYAYAINAHGTLIETKSVYLNTPKL
jgi:hypothetical protein